MQILCQLIQKKVQNSTDFKNVSTADSCRSTNEASDLTEETVASERDTDLEYPRTKIGHLFYRLGIFFRNLWNRLSRLWQKICRIPSSVENFTLTIQNICAKIESYQKFLEHPRTKAAFFSHKGQVFPVASALYFQPEYRAHLLLEAQIHLLQEPYLQFWE
mgnify:CR=1 FL=1